MTKTSKFIRAYGMTLCEMAKKLGISTGTIYSLHYKGKLKHLEIIDPVEAFKSIEGRIIRLVHNINSRCNNPNDIRYKNYGGRGIKNFLTMEDLIYLWKRDNAEKMEQPSIDRIDNNGNYILENCRFIEMSENRKRAWEPLDKNCMNSKQLAAEIGVHEKTIRNWFDKKFIPGIRIPCENPKYGRIRFNLNEVSKALKITLTLWLATLIGYLLVEAAVTPDIYPFSNKNSFGSIQDGKESFKVAKIKSWTVKTVKGHQIRLGTLNAWGAHDSVAGSVAGLSSKGGTK